MSDIVDKLPGLLRILGTGALLVAMYFFLIKGWQGGNDLVRYLMMLGHTGVLAVLGLASGYWLKENKGARLLLTLALVSIPINFAILGAFIFSQTGLGDLSFDPNYPNAVAWAVDSLQTALLTSGGAMIILLPVTLLGFTVLARSMSKRLTILFLFSNLALLIPVREPLLMGLIALVISVVGMIFTHNTSQQHVAAKTREGLIALGLQALPLGVLIGRNLFLYTNDLFLFTVMAMTVYILLRQLAAHFDKQSSIRYLLDFLALIPSVAIIPLLVSTLDQMGLISQSLLMPISFLISAGMIYDIAHRTISYAKTYRWIAAVVLAFGMLLNMYWYAGALTSLVTIIAGLGLFIFGYKNRQRGFFVIGVILSVIGSAQLLYQLVHHFNLGSWASMAIIGIVSIVAASLIESKGGKLQQRFATLKDNFTAWEG